MAPPAWATVFGLALCARLAHLALLLALDASLPDYDTSAPLRPIHGCSPGAPGGDLAGAQPRGLLGALARSASGLAVWDSVYFLRLAECGYEYEQFYAFFPLLPGRGQAGGYAAWGARWGRAVGAHGAWS
jgi:phosphatidylinositol glycan class V